MCLVMCSIVAGYGISFTMFSEQCWEEGSWVIQEFSRCAKLPNMPLFHHQDPVWVQDSLNPGKLPKRYSVATSELWIATTTEFMTKTFLTLCDDHDYYTPGKEKLLHKTSQPWERHTKSSIKLIIYQLKCDCMDIGDSSIFWCSSFATMVSLWPVTVVAHY